MHLPYHAPFAMSRRQICTLQDAIAQETLALAEKEEEHAARQSVLQSTSSSVPRGQPAKFVLGQAVAALACLPTCAMFPCLHTPAQHCKRSATSFSLASRSALRPVFGRGMAPPQPALGFSFWGCVSQRLASS